MGGLAVHGRPHNDPQDRHGHRSAVSPPSIAGRCRKQRRGIRLALAAASAALLGVVALGSLIITSPSAHAAGPQQRPSVPDCPPDCGRVADGDPLLLPYMSINPGPGWLAVPGTAVQPYVQALRKNLMRDGGRTLNNVVAARWQWSSGQYALQIVLVSSSSLAHLQLGDPRKNASDLCAASHGVGIGRVIPVPGIPNSITGLCDVPRSSRWSTVVTFDQGNVAVLLQVASFTNAPMDGQTVLAAARAQYQLLPPGGVLVSEGGDLPLVLLWLALLVALVTTLVMLARRGGGGRQAIRVVGAAYRRRRVALGVSLLAVIGSMAFVMLESSVLHGVGQWVVANPNDLWRNWADAANITYSGGLGHLYGLDTTLETAPALQVLTAPVARLSFGLPFPYSGDVLYPTALWVAGPLFLSFLALPICAGDRWLSMLGVNDLPRRLAVLGTMAVTLPVAALVGGHPEDLVALGAILYGLCAALEGRHRAVGWWLGTALAFQFFAVLAVPLALVLLKRRQWLTAIVPMVVLPLVVLAVPLAVDPMTTLHQLLHQHVYADYGYITPTWRLDPGAGGPVRALEVLASVLAAIWIGRDRHRTRVGLASVVLWTLAVLFALRVFEAELVPYFLAPALALFPLSASRGPWWRLAGACALAIWLTWWAHVPVEARWTVWLALIAQLAVLGWLAWPRAGQRNSSKSSIGPDADSLVVAGRGRAQA